MVRPPMVTGQGTCHRRYRPFPQCGQCLLSTARSVFLQFTFWRQLRPQSVSKPRFIFHLFSRQEVSLVPTKLGTKSLYRAPSRSCCAPVAERVKKRPNLIVPRLVNFQTRSDMNGYVLDLHGGIAVKFHFKR